MNTNPPVSTDDYHGPWLPDVYNIEWDENDRPQIITWENFYWAATDIPACCVDVHPWISNNRYVIDTRFTANKNELLPQYLKDLATFARRLDILLASVQAEYQQLYTKGF